MQHNPGVILSTRGTMVEIIRFFCSKCNPQRFYQQDRRTTNDTEEQSPTVLPFSEADRRALKNRRKVRDRRIVENPPKKTFNRRAGSKGRRPFDGYAWFEGCIEEAIKEQWYIKKGDESHSPVSKNAICPKRRYKVR